VRPGGSSALHAVVLAAALATAARVSPATEADQAEGSACIATFSEVDREPGIGGRRPRRTYAFAVRFDDGPRVSVPTSAPTSVSLTTGQPHLVRIFDGDELIESFHFTFEARKSSRLCLTYVDFYQTWRLEPAPRRAKWCRCEPPPDQR